MFSAQAPPPPSPRKVCLHTHRTPYGCVPVIYFKYLTLNTDAGQSLEALRRYITSGVKDSYSADGHELVQQTEDGQSWNIIWPHEERKTEKQGEI